MEKKKGGKLKWIIIVIIVIGVIGAAVGGNDNSDMTDSTEKAESTDSKKEEKKNSKEDSKSENKEEEKEEGKTDSKEEQENINTPNEDKLSTDNFLINSDLTTKDVLNGSGDTVIGECAYIRITDAELKEITSDLLKEFADTVVANSEYNWVSIITSSDKGLIFSGSDPSFATYGKLGKDGSLHDIYGICILDSNGNYTYTENK